MKKRKIYDNKDIPKDVVIGNRTFKDTNEDEYLQLVKNYFDMAGLKWIRSFYQQINKSNFYSPNSSEYELYEKGLFEDIDTSEMIALEYGCGPGRNIINYNDRFKRIDGCDISSTCKEASYINTEQHNITNYNYYVGDGKTIPCESNQYDLVFSLIVLQHIPIHDIRFKIMEDVYRVLKDGGYFCFQMGYGGYHAKVMEEDGVKTFVNECSHYLDNCYDVIGTNSTRDVSVMDVNYILKDIQKIGFKTFDYQILETGPADYHYNYIYIRVQK